MEEIIKSFAPYGFGGLMALVLAWFYWHTITKTMPDMTQAFAKALDDAVKSFREEAAEQRRACKEESAVIIQILKGQGK